MSKAMPVLRYEAPAHRLPPPDPDGGGDHHEDDPRRTPPPDSCYITNPYPKDNEPRTMGPTTELVAQLADSITTRGLKAGDLLFATREGTPFSRNTFRTRVWRPAVAASGMDFQVRVHDLRHAHASWLLAGGSDLKSVMDRMGHAQITTTQKPALPHPPRRRRQEPHRPRPDPPL